MKKFLLVCLPVLLIAILTAFAYNSDKGPAKQTDGITELPQQKNDSLLLRGKHLINSMHYSDQDLQAIALYLRNR
jgi:hypothetical protein